LTGFQKQEKRFESKSRLYLLFTYTHKEQLMPVFELDEKILSVDIGGSKIKATVLDIEGKMLRDYEKTETPFPANPQNVIKVISALASGFHPFTKVSVGFPGYVRDGIVRTAPNLDNESWKDFDLSTALTNELGQPTRVVNDADLQGLGIAEGKGLEMVVTLGTGFGTALLMNGILLPHFEIAHHPLSKDRDYDQYIGNAALQDAGLEKWNKRMRKVIAVLKTVYNYDHLYISGGNARKLDFELDETITLANNLEGIRGGAKLWQR
jgi:polyphosphate glucokinase